MHGKVTDGSPGAVFFCFFLFLLQLYTFPAKFQRVIFGSRIISQPRDDFQETLGTEVQLSVTQVEFVHSARTSLESTWAQKKKLNTVRRTVSRLCIKPIAHTQPKAPG